MAAARPASMRGPSDGRPPPEALTATVDLSALRRRLRMEQTQALGRAEIPASRASRDAGAGDVGSTQLVPRVSRSGRSRRQGRSRAPDVASTRQRRGPVGDGVGPVDDGPDRRADDSPAVERGVVERGVVDLTDLAEPDGGTATDRADSRDGDGGGGPSTRSKAIWTLADQGVSSATNAAVSFLIAHQVSNEQYGAFGIAYTLFSLVIGMARAGGGIPLSMTYAGADRESFRAAASATTGASLVYGVVVGIAFVIVGVPIGGPVGASLTAMGFALPGLLLQDAWRFVFFALGKPFGAFLNDVAWAVVQILGIGLLIHRGVADSSPLLLAWGASALVAALLGIAQADLWPAPRETLRWLRENKENSRYLAAEFVTLQGALQTSLLVIGAVGSLAAIGDLQGARTLLGPTTVVGVGLVSFALPEFSRRTSMTTRARERSAYRLSLLVLTVGAVWSLIFYLLPGQCGRWLLGDSWDGVRSILGLSILQYLAAAVPIGPACMIYALGKTRLSFRVNLCFAPALFGFPIVGLMLGDAQGAVIGYNLAFWAIAPVWFVLLRRVGREHDAEQAARRPGTPDRAGPADRTAAAGGRDRPDRRGDGRGRSEDAARRESSRRSDPPVRRHPVDADGRARVTDARSRRTDVSAGLERELSRPRGGRMGYPGGSGRSAPGESHRRIDRPIGAEDDVDRGDVRPDGDREQRGRGSGSYRGG